VARALALAANDGVTAMADNVGQWSEAVDRLRVAIIAAVAAMLATSSGAAAAPRMPQELIGRWCD
jgi:hypothetical protein